MVKAAPGERFFFVQTFPSNGPTLNNRACKSTKLTSKSTFFSLYLCGILKFVTKFPVGTYFRTVISRLRF